MKKLLAAAAALFLSIATVGPAFAQAAGPTTIDGVMAICTVVIDEQYDDRHEKDGQCIAAVQSFLNAIGAKSAEADPLIADAILALVELYRLDADCKIGTTELPEAIALAASSTLDQEVAAEYQAISQQIDVCDFDGTAAINDEIATQA